MEWFIAVVVIAILGVAAMAAAGGMGEMAEEPVRQAMRFGVTLRGYAMNQVDDLLDRLTREIAERDATIAELTGPPLGQRPSRGDEAPAQQGAGTDGAAALGSPIAADVAPSGERA
jgi:DivIVA domain-containing protein